MCDRGELAREYGGDLAEQNYFATRPTVNASYQAFAHLKCPTHLELLLRGSLAPSSILAASCRPFQATVVENKLKGLRKIPEN